MKKSDIELILHEAFCCDPLPEGDELVEMTGHIFEREEVLEAFSGRRWQDLDQDFLEGQDEALYLMAPEGRRYYLPAFLIASLHMPAAWFFPASIVLRLFAPLRHPVGHPSRDNFEQFLKLLTRRQKQAVKTFLEYATLEHPSHEARRYAKIALRVLWRKY